MLRRVGVDIDRSIELVSNHAARSAALDQTVETFATVAIAVLVLALDVVEVLVDFEDLALAVPRIHNAEIASFADTIPVLEQAE